MECQEIRQVLTENRVVKRDGVEKWRGYVTCELLLNGVVGRRVGGRNVAC